MGHSLFFDAHSLIAFSSKECPQVVITVGIFINVQVKGQFKLSFIYSLSVY